MEGLATHPSQDLRMTAAVYSTCKDSALVPLLGPIVTAQTEHTKGVLSICITSSPLCPCTAECFSMCSLANPCSLQQEILFRSSFL